ncbi:MAG: Gfo/Idh/MocA family oxidoreductase [Spirochaetales bacterium]|nr:Gfo/Idh/MocA family oxidoreductase [Spirochaetales bacterium]
MNKIRAGFIGAGFAANFHYEALENSGISFAEPVGVYSKRRESREKFAKVRDLKAFNSVGSLLESVDVVHICVPPALHEPMTVKALEHGVNVIVEKPFTGYFGPPAAQQEWRPEDSPGGSAGEKGSLSFTGSTFPKEAMLKGALESAGKMLNAEKKSKAAIYYAENWVFSPVIKKETEILRKTAAQILWIMAEESHSGSHSQTYGIWRYSGGGSIMGKGTHPLTAALYLKRIEGAARSGKAIRPLSVSARTHEITRLPGYIDRGYLRTDYRDVEDYGFMHITFEDGTVADIFSTEIVMGGVHNWLEVFANNHRTRCNINPIDAVETFNPKDEQFKDIYVVEKIGTKQGWSKPAPDENWMNGYVQEMHEFYTCMREGRKSFSSSELGYDTVNVIYSAYLSSERNGREVKI